MTTNNILVTVSPVDSLIGGFRAHLLGRSMPAPAFVRLDILNRKVSVYPHGGRTLASKVGALLLWAYTLNEVTAEWWRTLDDLLHVTVHGRTEGGLRLEIYNSGRFSDWHDLVHLDPDQSEDVSLDELNLFVGLLRDTHKRPKGEA